MLGKLVLTEKLLPGKNAGDKDSHGGLGTRKGFHGLPRQTSAAQCDHCLKSFPKPAIIYELGQLCDCSCSWRSW